MKKVYWIAAAILFLVPGIVWSYAKPEAPGRISTLYVENNAGGYISEAQANRIKVIWHKPAAGKDGVSGYDGYVYYITRDNVSHYRPISYFSQVDNNLVSAIKTEDAGGIYSVTVNGSWADSRIDYPRTTSIKITNLAIFAQATKNGQTVNGEPAPIAWVIDNTAPVITGIGIAEDPAGGKRLASYFHGKVNIKITANDGESGMNEAAGYNYQCSNINAYNKGSTYVLDTGSFLSGTYPVYCYVKDKVGNTSPTQVRLINVDNDHPANVQADSIQVRLNTSTTGVLGNMRISWAAVADAPVSVFPVYYNYALVPETDSYNKTNASGLSGDNVLIDITRGRVYKLAVQPEDYFGQAGDWTAFDHPIYIPETPATIKDIIVKKSAKPGLGVPEYLVTVVLHQDSNYLYLDQDPASGAYSLQGIKIYCDGGEVTTHNTSWDIVAQLADQGETGWSYYDEDGVQSLAFTFPLAGAGYSHKTCTFSVHTWYPAYLGGAEEWIDDSTAGITLYNYPARFSVELLDKNRPGQVIAAYRVTPDPERFGHEFNSEPAANIALYAGTREPVLRITDITDPEGDTLQYKPVTGTPTEYTTGNIDLEAALGLLPDHGTVSFRIAYKETNNAPEYNPDFETILELTLDINTMQPCLYNGYALVDLNNVPLAEYEGTLYTQSGQVILKNLLTSNADYINIAITGGNSYTIPVDAVNGNSVTLTLPSGDGNKQITVQAVNQYGNSSDPVHIDVTLDTTPPAVPRNSGGAPAVSYNQLPEAGAVEIILPGAVGDIAQYWLYLPGLLPDENVLPADTPAYRADISGLAPDTLLYCNIKARDKAGHVSVMENFSICTPASPGSLAAEPVQTGTSLTWAIAVPGSASRYALQQLNSTGSSLYYEIDAGAGQFVLPDLESQASYTFGFYAMNAHGYKTAERDAAGYVKRYTYTLGNNKPAWQPDPLHFIPPLYTREGIHYIKADFTLQWDDAVDADANDTLYYLVQYREAGTAAWDTFTTWQRSTSLETVAGGLGENTAYEMRVLVRDENMSVENYAATGIIAFVADGQPPAAQVERAPGFQPVIRITACDNLAGIGGAAWNLVQEAAPVLAGRPLVFEYDQAANNYTALIDLDTASREQNTRGGNYTLVITITDNTGNTAVIEEYNILIDQAPPVIGQETILLGTACSTGYVALSLDINDLVGGVKTLYYDFIAAADSPASTLPGAVMIRNSRPVNLEGKGSRLELVNREVQIRGEAGGLYYLALCAEDWAGNRSAVVTYNRHGVLVDRTPPAGELTLTGLMEQDGNYYWNNSIPVLPGAIEKRRLGAVCTARDDETNCATVLYGICEAEAVFTAPVRNWYATMEAADAAHVYEHGTAYLGAAKLVNGAGGERIVYSRRFTYDRAEVAYGAAGSTKLITSTGTALLAAGTQATATAACGERIMVQAYVLYDKLTPYTDYKLKIEPAAGGPGFMEQVPGSRNGWLVKREYNRQIAVDENTVTYGSQVEFLLTVPATLPGVYRLTLENNNCISGSNLAAKDTAEFLIHITGTGSGLEIRDNGPCAWLEAGATAELKAGWQYEGTIYGIVYRVREEGKMEPVTSWSLPVTNREIVIPVNEWTAGTRYYLEAAPVYAAGGEADYAHAGRSLPGVVFDSTLPVLEEVNGPAACTTDNLWLTWKTWDEESGIERVQAKVLKAMTVSNPATGVLETGWEDISGRWIDVTANRQERIGLFHIELTDEYGRALDLNTGDSLALLLEVTNGAGRAVERKSAPVKIDNTAPPIPVVLDQGAILPLSAYPVFNWIFSEDDPESGIRNFRWALTRNPQDLTTCSWREQNDNRVLDLGTEINPGEFTREHGMRWYLAVQAVNGAGSVSAAGISNGFVYDATAPLVTKVELQQAHNGVDSPVNYITDTTGLQASITASEDVGTVGVYSATPGKLDRNYEWEALQPAVVQDISAEEERQSTDPGYAYLPGVLRLPDIDPALVNAGEILVLKGAAENTAGQAADGYSEGTMLVSAGAVLQTVHGYVDNGVLYASWQAAAGRAPVIKYMIILKELSQAGSFPAPEDNWVDAGTGQGYTLPVTALPGGRYILFVKCLDAAGYTAACAGPVITVDHTAPEITAFSYSQAVSSLLRFSVTVLEDLSGVEEYAFGIGTGETPLLYSEGWIGIFTSAQQLVDYTVDLSLLAHIPAAGVLYLQVRVKNGNGLWSQPVQSTAITCDRQQPQTPLVSVDAACTLYSSQITGVKVTAAGEIVKYRMGVIAEAEKAGCAAAGLDGFPEFYPGAAAGGLVLDNLTAHITAGNSLQEGCYYLAAVQTMNSAGTWSETGFSNPVLADLSDPAGSLETDTLLVVNDSRLQAGTVQVLSPVYADFTVHDLTSKQVTVRFSLSRDGTRRELAAMHVGSANYHRVLQYPVDLRMLELQYGYYTLQAQVTDEAGREGTISGSCLVLINAPPLVKLNNPVVNPGETVNFMDELMITDPETGMYDPGHREVQEQFRYEWDFNGDSMTDLEYDPLSGAEWTEPVQYYGAICKPGHPVCLTVTDPHGLTAIVESRVYVLFTSAGTLATDELWDDDHGITGSLVIPENITLTIGSGVQVLVTGNYRVTVYGRLVMGTGSTLKYRNEVGLYAGDWWQGILLEGGSTAQITGAVIKQAVQAISLNGQVNAVIGSTVFDHNQVGVHATGIDQVLESCTFTNNIRYAIKEDGNADPVVNHCSFYNNSYDYYDENETVIKKYNEED